MDFEDFLVMISLNLLDLGYRKCSETKPRGLYFSKALFEGLTYGGKDAFQNRLG